MSPKTRWYLRFRRHDAVSATATYIAVSRTPQVEPDMERSLALYEQLEAHTRSGRYLRDIALLSHSAASEADRRHDFERMRKLLDRAIEIDTRRVAAQPLDRNASLDLSFDLSMLGTWHESSDDLQSAVEAFRKVLDIRVQLARLDERDEQAKDRLLYVLVTLGRLCGQLREYRESAGYYRRAVDLGAELTRLDSRPNAQFANLVAQAKAGLERANGRR